MFEANLIRRLPQGMEQDRLAESLEAPNEPSRKYGLLIVDDEGGVRGVLNVGMRRQGFTVWLAADDAELSALLGNGPSGSIRPIAESNMVGRKMRVAMQRPDSPEFFVWTVRVLWTVRLRDGLYENGAAILETGQADPSFRNQRPPDPSQWAYSGFASPSPYLTFIQALFRSPKLDAGRSTASVLLSACSGSSNAPLQKTSYPLGFNSPSTGW